MNRQFMLILICLAFSVTSCLEPAEFTVEKNEQKCPNEGAKVCLDNDLMICTSAGVWVKEKSCKDSTPFCDAVKHECTASLSECTAENAAAVCRRDNAAAACSDGKCTFICNDGYEANADNTACIPKTVSEPECTADNAAEKCAAKTPANANAACTDDKCSFECSEGYEKTADGAACTPKPIKCTVGDKSYSVGDKFCDDSGKLNACKADGTLIITACEKDQVCSQNASACADILCDTLRIGEKKCDDGQVKVCGADTANPNSATGVLTVAEDCKADSKSCDAAAFTCITVTADDCRLSDNTSVLTDGNSACDGTKIVSCKKGVLDNNTDCVSSETPHGISICAFTAVEDTIAPTCTVSCAPGYKKIYDGWDKMDKCLEKCTLGSKKCGEDEFGPIVFQCDPKELVWTPSSPACPKADGDVESSVCDDTSNPAEPVCRITCKNGKIPNANHTDCVDPPIACSADVCKDSKLQKCSKTDNTLNPAIDCTTSVANASPACNTEGNACSFACHEGYTKTDDGTACAAAAECQSTDTSEAIAAACKDKTPANAAPACTAEGKCSFECNLGYVKSAAGTACEPKPTP